MSCPPAPAPHHITPTPPAPRKGWGGSDAYTVSPQKMIPFSKQDHLFPSRTTFCRAGPLFPSNDPFFPSDQQYVQYSKAVFPIGCPLRAKKYCLSEPSDVLEGPAGPAKKMTIIFQVMTPFSRHTRPFFPSNDPFFQSHTSDTTTVFRAGPLFSKRGHFFPSTLLRAAGAADLLDAPP